MKVLSRKVCDMCGCTVATKYEILYHTNKPFVTIRLDEPVIFSNMEEHTTKSKLHFCTTCFDEISCVAEKKLKEREGK